MVWLLLSVGGLAHWLGTLGHTQRDAENWIKANIPAESVLIGDAASGIGVRSAFQILPVIPNLCNDRAPLSQFSQRPLYVCILDGDFVEKWWKERYPHLINPQNRVQLFPRVVKFPVGIYRISARH
jgi:hypothetical protein